MTSASNGGDVSGTPSVRYATVVADPPWPLPWKSLSTRMGGGWGKPRRYTVGRQTLGYPTMSVADIADWPLMDTWLMTPIFTFGRSTSSS